MKEETKAVFLPAELYDRIAERAKLTGFSSIDKYVIFLLDEVVKENGEETRAIFSKAEEEEIKKRLKELGYLV